MNNDIDPIDAIKARFQELPTELRDAITASDWSEKVKKVADKNSLMLDQMSLLQNEVLFVMLGLEPAADFVNNVAKELNVDRNKAITITTDINELVLAPIKEFLQQWEKTATPEDTGNNNYHDLSVLEKAGNFTIEPQKVHDESVDVTSADKARILSEIENPPTSIFPEKIVSVPVPEEKFTEPLVDQLLTGTTSSGERKVFINIINAAPSKLPTDTSAAPTTETTPSTSLPPDAPVTPKGPDLYREEAK